MTDQTLALEDPMPLAPAEPQRIAVVMNRKSGTNARDREAIDRALEVFGRDRCRLYQWAPKKKKPVGEVVGRALDEGADMVVAAGGDGTAMAVAGAMLGQPAAFAVLPLGTFNYFARGLGLDEEPAVAAQGILDARSHPIRVGQVNGTVFLNNASLGIYPAVLKQRESVYARYGRRRIMAHWSLARTFLKFQRPMQLQIEADGDTFEARTPLLFVSRSAYQLETFGLKGAEAIGEDRFAVLIGRGKTRADLFRTAFRLCTNTAEEGRDYDFLAARSLTVRAAKKRTLLAYDGEKGLAPSPFEFRMSEEPLTIRLPQEAPA
ncbi:diacylglycerol/lipid kinase family protein [Mangrovicoccus ximenensis]|uniref:diacylglycerol/lipid kinase family protein n=1 Tax=Mangrovicoccus ximenensis TaxID=1911570 RepID=UPI001F365A74|nr:diacylglycerol kinase family protein [Mangrovicoccus ximenensis]